MIKYLPGDKVAVHGYQQSPVTFPFRTWLNVTDQALATFEASIGKLPTLAAFKAMRWLRACGIDSREKAEDYKARRPLFDQPADPSRIIRCKCCNSPLTDPVSKLLGIGPVCRNPQKKAAPRFAHAEAAA